MINKELVHDVSDSDILEISNELFNLSNITENFNLDDISSSIKEDFDGFDEDLADVLSLFSSKK